VRRLALLVGLAGILAAQTPDSLSLNLIRDNLSAEGSLGISFNRSVVGLVTEFDNYLDYKWYQGVGDILTGQNYAVENRLTWSIRSDRTDALNWTARTESNVYLDRRTNLGGDLRNHALLAGLSYPTTRWGDYQLLAGGRIEERHTREARAKAFELFQTGNWSNERRLIHSKLGFTEDYFSNWHNHRREATVLYNQKIAEGVKLRSALNWLDKRHQFYTDSTGSTQRRNITDLNWRNSLEYRVNPNTHLVYKLNWKDLRSETVNHRILLSDPDTTLAVTNSTLNLQNILGLHWQSMRVAAGGEFEVTTIQKKYYIDNAQSYYRFSTYANFPGWVIADSAQVNARLSRLKYDTPDKTNHDDRDEWRLNVSGQLIWKQFPYSRLQVGLITQFYHLVYLYSDKSGENYWNRTFGINSKYRWSRGVWRSDLRTALQANYYDYDYDSFFLKNSQPIRSFMHRSLLVEERLNRRVFYRWSVQCDLSYKWEDDGRLDWDRFIEDVMTRREQELLTTTTRYIQNHWEAWVGYSFKTRSTEYIQPDPSTESGDWRGQGPIAGFVLRNSRRTEWDISLEYFKVVEAGRQYTLPRFNLRGLIRF